VRAPKPVNSFFDRLDQFFHFPFGTTAFEHARDGRPVTADGNEV
jgi:hypothetical protein